MLFNLDLMTFHKFEFRLLFKMTFTWTILNLILNGLGRWIGGELSNYGFGEIDILYELRFITFQSVSFGLILVFSISFIKDKRLAPYLFVTVQFVIFHVIFLMNIDHYENAIQFVTSWDNLGLQYLYYNGQHLVDILTVYYPIEGIFDDGMFIPNNLLRFYALWILLVIIYYFILTRLTMTAMKLKTN